MEELSIDGIDWYQMTEPLIFYLTDSEGAILTDEEGNYLIMEQGPNE